MGSHISVKLYNPGLENPQKKFLTDCATFWLESEPRAGVGLPLRIIHIWALSTVLGEEAQDVCRKLMEIDIQLPAGHVDVDRAAVPRMVSRRPMEFPLGRGIESPASCLLSKGGGILLDPALGANGDLFDRQSGGLRRHLDARDEV